MARKPLLTEAEIRSFMKLANLAPIGDAKMNEMGYYGKDDKKDKPHKDSEHKDPKVKEEGSYYGKDDSKDDKDLEEQSLEFEPALEEEEEELEMDAELGTAEEEPPAMDVPEEPVDDMGDDDLGMDDLGDADADVGGGDTESQFMDLVQQLADLVGVDVSMDAEAEDDIGDMGDDLGMGDDADSLEGGDDLGDEAALDMDEPELDDDDEEPGMRAAGGMMEEDIVAEVARRVADRLQAESSKQKLADELTEKIFNRLTNKG